MFYCPGCNTVYCDACYTQVVKKDGCWNCGAGGNSESDLEFKEETLEDELLLEAENQEHKIKKS